jgi:hypothetical protein
MRDREISDNSTLSSLKNLKRSWKSGSSGIVSIVHLPEEFERGQSFERRFREPVGAIRGLLFLKGVDDRENGFVDLGVE